MYRQFMMLLKIKEIINGKSYTDKKNNNDLTGKKQMTIVQISMKENVSERTVTSIIRQIKLKMIKAIMLK